MEKSKKPSHDEIKTIIAEIYKEMESTLSQAEERERAEQGASSSLEESASEPLPSTPEHEVQEPPSEQEPLTSPSLDDQAETDEMISEDAHEEEMVSHGPSADPHRDEALRAIVDQVRGEVGKVVVGYDHIVDHLLMCLISGGHVLLEGMPGIAKTTLAKTFTAVLGLDYKRIQFTPDILPQDITGHYFFDQKETEFRFREGPVFTNLVLADEINRSTPKTQSALLEAMEERQVTIEGTTFGLPRPFMVLATVNPVEQEGVYHLPIAQSDRFMCKVLMGYVGADAEVEVLRRKASGQEEQAPTFEHIDITPLRKAFWTTHVSDGIMHYIRDIVHATRGDELVSLGASPRAAEHMLYCAKAHACMDGRRYVIPDDVKAIAESCLNHRLLLSPDADMDESSTHDIVKRIISSVKVPLEEK